MSRQEEEGSMPGRDCRLSRGWDELRQQCGRRVGGLSRGHYWSVRDNGEEGGQREETDPEGPPSPHPVAHPEVLLFILQPCWASWGLQQRWGIALSSCKSLDRSRVGLQAQRPVLSLLKQSRRERMKAERAERCDRCICATKMRMREIMRQQSCRIPPCAFNPLLQGIVSDAL